MKNPRTLIICSTTEGKRMRPLTAYLPKSLLPINDLPLICHHIHAAYKRNFEHIIITLESESGPLVEQALNKGAPTNLDISFVYVIPRGGLCNSLLHAMPFVQESSFAVTLGDKISTEILDFPICMGHTDLCISLTNLNNAGKVVFDERITTQNGYVLSYEDCSCEQSHPSLTSLCFCGSFVANTSLFEELQSLRHAMSYEDFQSPDLNLGPLFSQMCAKRKVTYVEKTQPHFNINTLEDYKCAQAYFAEI